MLVEVDKSHKGLDFGHISQGWPVTNASHLDGVHFYATFQKDEAEILYHGLSECAFLGLEVELMLVEDIKDLYYNGVMWLLSLATEDEDVIHVNNHDSFIYEFSEDFFIIVWNVTRLLVRPKNMTRGSNKPWFI